MLISSVLKVRLQLSFNSKQTDSRGQKGVLETQNVLPAQLFHLALKEMICASQFSVVCFFSIKLCTVKPSGIHPHWICIMEL